MRAALFLCEFRSRRSQVAINLHLSFLYKPQFGKHSFSSEGIAKLFGGKYDKSESLECFFDGETSSTVRTCRTIVEIRTTACIILLLGSVVKGTMLTTHVLSKRLIFNSRYARKRACMF